MVVSLVDDTAVEQFLSFDEEVDRHQDDLIREYADAALGGRFERSGVEVGVGEQAAQVGDDLLAAMLDAAEGVDPVGVVGPRRA